VILFDSHELELVRLGLQQGHALNASAMQGPRIYAPNPPDAFILPDMGMTLKEVIVLVAGENTLFEAQIIPMDDGKSFAAQFELAEGSEALEAQTPGILLKCRAVPVVVAPDKGAGKAGQKVEDALGSDIPTMNVELRSLLLKQAKRSNRRGNPIVSITENPNPHEPAPTDDELQA
jgi:hypothetical protein